MAGNIKKKKKFPLRNKMYNRSERLNKNRRVYSKDRSYRESEPLEPDIRSFFNMQILFIAELKYPEASFHTPYCGFLF